MSATYPDPNLSTAAREWAELSNHHWPEKTRAAAELIQSLPDTIVDGDKLRKVIADWDNRAITSDAYTLYQQVLALLPAPSSLPILAELIEQGNDPQKYQWMQCTVEGRGDDTFVITDVRELVSKILHPDGRHEVIGNGQVIPLPGEPKLKWPGSRGNTATADSEGDVQAACADDIEPALPRPEDVPAGEAWMILRKGHGWVGTRDSKDGANLPWALSRLDGVKAIASKDLDINLVTRLVPETR